MTRYARWNTDIYLYPETFTSAPELELSFSSPLTSGTEDSPLTIALMNSRPPIDTLSQLYPHAPVAVLIEEMVVDEPDTRRIVYSGKVSQTEASMRGAHLFTKVTVDGLKVGLTRTLGLQALSTTPYPFDTFINTQPLQETCTVLQTQAQGNPVRILVDFDNPYASQDNEHWNNGRITINGNSIKIRQYVGNGLFDLSNVPPPSWTNEHATLTPGSNKSIANERYWNNETNFGGFGIAMPAANPTISVKR